MADGTNKSSLKIEHKKKQKSGLLKCFRALVDRKQVDFELDVVKLIIQKELQINMSELDPTLASILPYMLVFYIKTWPGWQKAQDYYSGKIQLNTWYEKFNAFIVLKLKYLIDQEYSSAITKDQQNRNNTEIGCQTLNFAIKETAPFNITLTSGPQYLNTIVFCDYNDDVLLKKHGEKQWNKDLSLKQLLNLPFVEVSFSNAKLTFKRKCKHEYRRLINQSTVPTVPPVEEFIDEINILVQDKPRYCFTLDYLKDYCNRYSHMLKGIVKGEKLNEIKAIMTELLEDISEIQLGNKGKPTMASNTSVLFQIGKKTYIRTKKLSKGDPTKTDLTYSETVIPKVEIALEHIETTVQDLNNQIHKLKQQNATEIIPIISYGCNFCENNFADLYHLKQHFKYLHTMEQPALCLTCKDTFQTDVLTAHRWQHTCSKRH